MTLLACLTLTAFTLQALPTVTSAAEEEKPKLLCPVSGKEASKEHSVKYKGAAVYFCCPNCPKAFEAEPAKFAAAANHQLVATKQFEQKGCPISGGKLNPETAVEIKGVSVSFCCNNCKGKVEAAEGAEKMDLVFGEKAFEKGFKKAKRDKE
ncbi:MAG: hypothetical protein CMJ46_02510 [Planctomyces sp.]|nr:hypothetical protein [Planctomyces sp.]